MASQGWSALRSTWVGAVAATALAIVLGSVWTPDGAAHRDHRQGAKLGTKSANDLALRAATRRALERQRRLERRWRSPAARRERLRSRTALRGASAPTALAAAWRTFPELLEQPLWRGPELRPGDDVERYLGDHSAVVDQQHGPDLFVESMTPLRARADDGRKRPIDVRLRQAGDRLEPRNALADTSVGVDLADGIALERSGIRISPAAAPETAPPRVRGDKAFFAHAAEDTDFLVAALPDGVETFWQLRSPRSPERHELRFDLPAGAELRRAEGTSAGTAPGAEVVRGDDRLATILPPTAHDAQGRPIPVELDIAGTTLAVRVAHRGADLAYPILVDPIVREEWWWRDNCGNFDYSGWRPQRVWEGSQWNFYGQGCSFWGNGLYIWTNDQAWTNYQHDEWGEWVWPAYPNTSVVRADFGQMNHTPRPVEWGDPNGTSTCVRTYIWSWSHGAQNYHAECGALSGHWDTACTGSPPCAHNNTSHDNAAVFNFQIQGGGWRYNPGWAFLGAAILTLHDFNVPRVTGLSAAPDTAWVHDTSHSFRVNAHDDGLGVKEIVFDGPGIWESRTHGCYGNRHWRCPYDWQSDGNAFSYSTASWGEGVHTLRARVWDVVNNPGDAQGNKVWEDPANRHTWQVRVDRTPPSFTGFAGALSQRGRWFRDGTHQLVVSARDAYSGIQHAELRVDGARVDTAESRSCDRGGCPQDLTNRAFNWSTAGYAEGAHEIRPYVRDPLNHARSDDAWQAKLDRSQPTIPAVTGRGAAEGDWVGPGSHDLAVDARDAYSGVQRVELHVDGRLEDAETASCPNGQCPTAFPATLTWDTTGEADGAHALRLVVTDLLGHVRERTWTARKDSVQPLALVTGTLWDSDGQVVREPSTLEIEAFDEDGAAPESGVRSIEVRVDDVRAFFASQSCASQPCDMYREWTYDPMAFADGEHTAEVIVTDLAGGEHVEGVDFLSEQVPALPAQTLDLATQPAARADGTAAGDRAGGAVTQVGDLNGDDLDDYAIGAPGHDGPNGLDAGAVYVVYGSGADDALDLGALGSRGFRIDGAALRERAGTAVANAGDVNGDGVDDLAIGAPQTGDELGIVPVQGRVYVVFGAAGGGGDVDLAQLGARGFRIDGPLLARTPLSATYDGRPRDFGAHLAGAESGLLAAGADVNGDERDDVVIGSSSESRNGRAQSGSTYVVFGKADAAPVDANALGPGGFRIDGALPGHLSGYAAAPAGDTNDDGLGDLALTAPGAHPAGRTNAGTAYVVFGKGDAANVDLATLGAQGYEIRGGDGDRLGFSVASLGDLDGDTRQDVAVGGHGALVVLGKDDTEAVDPAAGSWAPGHQRVSAPAGAEYDHALVSGGGDLNNDALPDLLVGFPDAAGTRGELYAVFGRARGAGEIALAGIGSHRGARFVGAAAGERAGASADTVDFATVDGSGALIGAPGAGSGWGSAYLVRGTALAGASRPPVEEQQSGMQAAAATAIPSRRQYDRTHGKKRCYPHRSLPYQHDGPRHIPGCRTTLRRRTLAGDVNPRNSNSRRTPRKPFDKTVRVPVVDSEGAVFAYMQQHGKRRFEVFDAAGTSVGTDSSAYIDVVGRACMKTPTMGKQHTLMRLHSSLGFTGFIRRSHLPAKAIVGVDRESDEDVRDRRRDGLDNDDIIEHYYSPCGNHRRLSRMRAIGGAPGTFEYVAFDPERHLYQGPSVGKRTNTGKRCDTVYNPRCGGQYDNYFSPHWPATVNGTAIVQPRTIHLVTATTGVTGGGLVNAVLREGWGADFRDRVDYTDSNVPCTREYVAQWWFGRVARAGWSQKTWGWVPRMRPRPRVAPSDPAYEGPPDRYHDAQDPNDRKCPPRP